MFANFLIGLREGLEASLVVGILVAYLCRSGHRRGLGAIWIGVAAAVAVSVGFGTLLYFGARELADRVEPLFAGALGVVAVGFVTYMVFWMRRAARHIRAELEDKLDVAIRVGVLALAATAFVAVVREGLETALFLWSNMRTNTGGGAAPLAGAVLGLVAAVALEYLLYRSVVRINLARFFRITGILLVIVAAGVLAGSVGDLQEGGALPGSNAIAFDVSAAVSENSWYGVLLKSVIGFHARTTWLMLSAWIVYLIPVLLLFIRPVRQRSEAVAASSVGTGEHPAAHDVQERPSQRGASNGAV
ncbi:FTR1 family protein (plasmid) [Streptomyces sp. L7]|uniref:iron uptake transporter permease EfeU n=1 Tax=Actinomycetes TaxID=1760 RepID=UPI00389A9BD1